METRDVMPSVTIKDRISPYWYPDVIMETEDGTDPDAVLTVTIAGGDPFNLAPVTLTFQGGRLLRVEDSHGVTVHLVDRVSP